MKKFLLVTGIRPNIIKAYPLYKYMKANNFNVIWVHSGQHKDLLMFSKLLPSLPKILDLDINSEDSSGTRMARLIESFSLNIKKNSPDFVIVFGDADSTLAVALASNKEGVPVIHVESGLRSFDKEMPEEINRILTDHISKILFVSEPSGILNLKLEGIYSKDVHLVGNIMLDCFSLFKERIEKVSFKNEIPDCYALFTIHRRSNLNKEKLQFILELMKIVKKRITIVFPVHPHTRKELFQFKLFKKYYEKCIFLEPLPYIKFMKLLWNAHFVVTDSGGVQEEATVLDVPCLTLRENTERPITLSQGTNQLIKTKEEFEKSFDFIMNNEWKRSQLPDLWDGMTAARITSILERINHHPKGLNERRKII